MPTIPQIETFKRDNINDLDTAVNTFVLEKFKETGHASIVKPHANGCTVIYFVDAPAQPQEQFSGQNRVPWPADLDHNRDRTRNRYGGRY